MKSLISKYMMFTILTLSIPVYSMDQVQQQPIAVYAPLQILSNEFIYSSSIKNAFQSTFRLICASITHHHNLAESSYWLKNQAPIEIGRLAQQLREQIKHSYNAVIPQYPFFNYPTASGKYFSLASGDMHIQNFYSYASQTLDQEEAKLYRKIKTLTSLLDSTISDQKTFACLNDAQLLQKTVERKILWENVKSLWKRIF